MKCTYNLKYGHAIRLKFGDTFLNFLTKLMLEATAGICSTITENLLLYYCNLSVTENLLLYFCNLSAFVIVVII